MATPDSRRINPIVLLATLPLAALAVWTALEGRLLITLLLTALWLRFVVLFFSWRRRRP